MQPPRLLRTRSSCAKTSRQQAPQRLLHSKDRPPSTPPTSASRRPWRTLQRRRATWTGLWRPRLQRRRPVRPVLADAKVMADNAQIAARNLADVSGQGGGGVSGGSSQAGIGQADKGRHSLLFCPAGYRSSHLVVPVWTWGRLEWRPSSGPVHLRGSQLWAGGQHCIAPLGDVAA